MAHLLAYFKGEAHEMREPNWLINAQLTAIVLNREYEKEQNNQ